MNKLLIFVILWGLFGRTFSEIGVDSFGFYRDIQLINNSTSTLLSQEVSIIIDTQVLVDGSKMLQNCVDVVFTIIDEMDIIYGTKTIIGPLQHWLETPCGSPNSVFWIKIDEIPPGVMELRMFYGNEFLFAYSGQVDWEGGFVAVTAGVTCSISQKWSTSGVFNGKYIRGGSSYGISGGDADHDHQIISATTGTVSSNARDNDCEEFGADFNALRDLPMGDHRHSINGYTTKSENLPPFHDFPVCESDKLNLASGTVVLSNINYTDFDVPGYAIVDELIGRFPRGSVSRGDSGGSYNHSHTINPGYTIDVLDSPNMVPCKHGASSVNFHANTVDHDHDISNSVIFSEYFLPPYITVLYIKSTTNHNLPFPGMIIGAKTCPPLGWELHTEYVNRFPLGGKDNIGEKGDVSSHSHTGSLVSVVDDNFEIGNGFDSLFEMESHEHHPITFSVELSQHIPMYTDVIFVKRKNSLPTVVSVEFNNGGGSPIMTIDSWWWLLVVTTLIGFFGGLVGVVVFVIAFYIIVFYKQRKTLKKIEKIEDLDMIMQEQRLESESAKDKTKFKFKINKKFVIDYEDVSLKKELGRGGSGCVIYKGQWGGNVIAFKVFRTKDISSQNTFDEFEKEVEVMCSISHPNLLQFYGCCLRPPRVGIVMEYCSNGNLKSYIIKNGNNLQLSKKLKILIGVINAMKYLHKREIIHRDLKSDNILLNANDVPKVCDFGISKIVEKANSRTMTKRIGTALYMAPELSLTSDYDHRVDIFSFGIVMYEVLTAKQPFGMYSNEHQSIEMKIANDENFRPNCSDENVPKDCKKYIQIMEKCWKGNPNERIESFKLLLKLLENVKHSESEKVVTSDDVVFSIEDIEFS